MNDSKKNREKNKTIVKEKYSEAIFGYITKNPQGVRFNEVQNELKIASPSTVSRNLKYLVNEGRIVQIENGYYPAGADFALPTFRKIIEVITPATRVSEAGNKPDPTVKIALEELIGMPGHPSPYQYSALPNDVDLLTLENILESIINGKISGMEGFITGLAQFISGSFRNRLDNDLEINTVLVGKIRTLEELLFEREGISESLSRGKIQDSAWYFIYTILCELKDKQISVILDRILTFSDKVGNGMKPANHEKVEDSSNISMEEKLNNIKNKIRNDLWCKQLRDVLFSRQFELFQRQLSRSSNPLLADFYGDLRQYAIGDHNQENGSSSKQTETGNITNQETGRNPD
jgi:DNA-binding HxlR family transcriptional regulator